MTGLTAHRPFPGNGRIAARRLARAAPWLLFVAAGSYIVYLAAAAGITRPFTQVYDADLHYAYRALRFNEGLPQVYFDHTGFTYALLLSWFIKLAAAIGAIPAATLSALRAHDPMGEAIAQAVFAGRVFSVLLSLAFCTVFAWGVWRLSRDLLLAAALTVVVATSGGVGYHTLALRPEMISALLVLAAYLAISEAQSGAPLRRHVLVGAAVAAAYLAFLAKQQALIPLLCAPVFALMTGAPLHLTQRALGPEGRARAVTVFLFALLAVLPFAMSHYIGTVLVGRAAIPLYTWVLLAYVLGAVGLYGALFGRHWIAVLHGLSAALFGAGAGFALNLFHLSHGNAAVNARFLDNLKQYGGPRDADFSGGAGYQTLLLETLDKLGTVLKTLLLPTDAWSAAAAAAMLAALAAGAALLRRGLWRQGLVAIGLALAGLFSYGVFALRGTQIFYEPYCVFLPLLGLGLAWPRLPRRRGMTGAVLVLALVLAAAQGVRNQARFVAAPLYTPHERPAYFCDWQKIWGPFLPESYYADARCWTAYARGLQPAERHFPPVGAPPKPAGQ